MQRPHPKKEIEAALTYAEACGWRVEPKKGNGHAWGKMLCPYNDAVVDPCSVMRQIAGLMSGRHARN